MKKTNWAAKDSADLYGILNWGVDYFGYDDNGNVTVVTKPGENKVETPLINIVNDMAERGMSMPVLVRFEDLLEDRIARLNNTFRKAIELNHYKGRYRGVFPIKVNQQCHVIEEIAEVGSKFGHGLEAGSKAELIIALAHLENRDSCIVCNGYKDEEFVDLGLQACKMGYQCFFVVEAPGELPMIIRRARKLGIKPKIGVRVKLSSVVGGHWNATSGDRSIFGLNITQLMELVETLRREEMLDCLQLLHYHLGSQIPNIRDIRSGVLEACQVYLGLVQEGAAMGFLDLGGGLAVDYDGSHTDDTHSRNYHLQEYCEDIIDVVIHTLDPKGVPHPDIITESGRATIAYSSVLLFNVLDVANFEPNNLPEKVPEEEHQLIHHLVETLNAAHPQKLQECYNDAVFYRDEIRELFKRGQISLRSRSLAENFFLQVMQKLLSLSPEAPRDLKELEKLKDQLSDIYYCNFSLFQSLPDIWAINQIFPVAPIHRLNEEPDRQAIIADITCDCDGKIDRFSSPQGMSRTLPLHSVREDQEYIIGVFLVGAYQETLGDLHNLFGDTNVVSVRFNPDGTYDIADEIEGDAIADVLSYVEYQPAVLKERFRKIAETSVRDGLISASERQEIMKAFSESMQGYTYYEKE